MSENASKVFYEATSSGFSSFAITAQKSLKIETKTVEKAANETKEDLKPESEINMTAAADSIESKEKTSNLFFGFIVMIVIVIVGILVYILIFAPEGKFRAEKTTTREEHEHKKKHEHKSRHKHTGHENHK